MLEDKDNMFRGYEEKDAHRALEIILDSLHLEIEQNIGSYPIKDIFQFQVQKCCSNCLTVS